MLPKRNQNGTTAMANLTLKNVPDRLYQSLKSTAARNRRSINAEAIRCLEVVLEGRRLDVDKFLARAERLRDQVSFRLTDEDINRAKRSGRP